MLFERVAAFPLGLSLTLAAWGLENPAFSAQNPPAQAAIVGQPRIGAAAVRETTAQIMARDRLRAAQPTHRHVAPRFVRPPASAATSTNAAAGVPAPGGISPLAAQTVSPTLNFTAATFSDCSGWPPDTMGTVGPTQFIIALNGRVRSFNKATGTADGGINATTGSFFSSVMTPGSNFTSDPRIRYDRLSGRWFITMIDVPGQQAKQPNRVMIAMSDSGIITANTVWSFFYFDGDTSNFADYPTLGIDANALYIGVNIFSTSTGSFVNTSAFVVRKSSLLSGGPIVVTPFTGLIATSGHPPRSAGPFTPQGVDNSDPAATEGYFIGVDVRSTSTLQLRRVSDPGGTPSLSGNVSISVGSFASPINVTVQGTSGTVDGLDDRLLAVHYRNGSLWTSHNVGVNSSGGTGSPDRDGVRWYQITGIPTGQTPSIVQSGTVYQSGSANLSYWMGTIMVSGQGHAAMGFTRAGPNNYLDAATTGRLVGDAGGSMDTPVTYASSSSAYNPTDGSNPHRWGDFSYTSLDPSDDMTMWTIQEWCQSSGNGFAVQVAKLLAPLPALPTSCTPAILTQSVANVSVVLQGSSSNGAGFFDPGAGFSNHITAAVNGGGITINSLAYNNPTNLTLNLSVAANAPKGLRTITVTNPDGQSATSLSGLLTIHGETNTAPTLEPIPDRTIAVGMTLSITNVASDPDGDQLTFSLEAGAAPNATINTTNGIFDWSPTESQIGTNSFGVVVTDNGSPPLSATQTFNVTVLHSNTPPVLAPVADRTIAVGMTLAITNVASDPDGDLLTFSLGPGAAPNATLNPTNGVFSWSPDQSQIGTNLFSVVVADDGLPPLSATQNFSVTVVRSNSPPVLAVISNQTIAVGMTLSITNVATDPDGDALTFSLEAGAVTNATINPTNGVFTWSPDQSQMGSNAFSVVVTDDGLPSLSATQSFAVMVLASNNPPVLEPIPDQTITAGMPLTNPAVASDPDSPPQLLTFSLGPGAAPNAAIDPTNGVFSWTPTQSQAGTNAFEVIVTDNGLPPLSATQSFNVTVLASNNPPVMAAISNQTIAVGMTLTITNSASDPDSPPQVLTFSLDSGAVTNADINPTNGVFTWTPTQDQIGTNAFEVVVTDDGLPPLSATQSFAVTVLASNSPPVLAAIPDQTITAGMMLTITNGATDPDSPPQVLTYSLGPGAAPNAAIDPTNGVFTWTPTQAQTGTNAFEVIVTDNGLLPLSATQSFNVTVLASNNPPVLAAISNQTIAVGMTLTITNSASDPDSPPQVLTFSLDSGAATNAAINPTNGVFTWAPTQDQIGTNAFEVVVTDDGLPPLSATQNFTVTVLASNNPPVLAAIPDQTITVGMMLTITNAATDPDSPPQVLTYSLGPGAAPNAAIDPTNGVFTWTPTQAQTGTNAFEVIVTDNGLPPLSATQSLNVTVLASNNPPVLAAISNQTIAVGMTLTITNAATDPDSPPQVLTFSLGPGAATNAAINPTNGVFTWAPIQDQIGTNAFEVVVTDDGLPPLSATQSFTVTVLASNNPPVLAPIADQTLYAGLTLVLTNSATDPDLPAQTLTYSLDPGAPAGAIIGATNGVLVWTPTEAEVGSNSVTVRVTDNGLPNLSDTQTFMVDVLPPPVLETITSSNDTIALTWNAISGTTYRVQFETNLDNAIWLDLAPDVVATGPTATAADTSPTNAARFYRVRVVP